MEKNCEKVNLLKILNKYSLSSKEKDELLEIILPIYLHLEFQKRMTERYLHHGKITLGEHILEDTVLTYILSKKYMRKKPKYRLDLAIKIAMLHDLYTIPWQNNELAKVKYFFSKHGFRHPIEAVINAISWYPWIFENTRDAQIIIDGILHHMFPLPVRSLNNFNIDKVELKNNDLYNSLPIVYQQIIINSLNRKRIGVISLSRSLYKEGRIMSHADKKVSLGQFDSFESVKALITGHNKKLENKYKK